ncbi:MAG: hypothetical protein Q8K21_14770 [Hydrogenophaga sp.]|uniref:hypothetical protein n=1 Tax=Hydrogenophaga sp. TaxID=1904254 RepID=UPI00272379EB|nr:hypothetical protein [Hydrogenophaga sp.]MDO9605168.1 hypothetical protein [Hydrogenophaga sp.]MDP2165448.1 hypothetical protein [Hydrogenophaga sp.]MDP3475440.1 hypothetical protein [Hydrogenophaga sp.]
MQHVRLAPLQSNGRSITPGLEGTHHQRATWKQTMVPNAVGGLLKARLIQGIHGPLSLHIVAQNKMLSWVGVPI